MCGPSWLLREHLPLFCWSIVFCKADPIRPLRVYFRGENLTSAQAPFYLLTVAFCHSGTRFDVLATFHVQFFLFGVCHEF